jgi:hypothetical protein
MCIRMHVLWELDPLLNKLIKLYQQLKKLGLGKDVGHF